MPLKRIKQATKDEYRQIAKDSFKHSDDWSIDATPRVALAPDRTGAWVQVWAWYENPNGSPDDDARVCPNCSREYAISTIGNECECGRRVPPSL